MLDVNHYYAKDADNVYLKGTKIDRADPKSFEIIFDYWGNYDYAKDKNNVYYKGQIIEGADTETFENVATEKEPQYYQDKNHRYKDGKTIIQ